MKKEQLFNEIIESVGIIAERNNENEVTDYLQFVKNNRNFNAEVHTIPNEEWEDNCNSKVYLPKDKTHTVCFLHNEINKVVEELAATNETVAIEFRHQTNYKILKDFITAKIYMSPDTTMDEAIFVAELLSNVIYAKLENYEMEYDVVRLHYIYKKASANITIDKSFIDKINYWYNTLMAA